MTAWDPRRLHALQSCVPGLHPNESLLIPWLSKQRRGQHQQSSRPHGAPRVITISAAWPSWTVFVGQPACAIMSNISKGSHMEREAATRRRRLMPAGMPALRTMAHRRSQPHARATEATVSTMSCDKFCTTEHVRWFLGARGAASPSGHPHDASREHHRLLGSTKPRLQVRSSHGYINMTPCK